MRRKSPGLITVDPNWAPEEPVLLDLLNTSLELRLRIGDLIFYFLLDFLIWFPARWAS